MILISLITLLIKMGRKVSNRTSYAILVILTASNLVQAAPIIISEDNKVQINLHQQLMMFEDLSGQQSIETVMKQQFHRVPSSDERILSFGYSQSVYWLKFELHNQTPNHNWLLEVGYPLLDTVEFYEFEQQKLVQQYLSGDHKIYFERPIKHRNFLFPLMIFENQSRTIYLKVASTSAVRIPLSLWNNQNFYESDQARLSWQGIYFGILIVMMLYNLFIFVSIREQAYLHYVFYVCSYILVQASLNGLSYQYLWPTWNEFNDKAIIFGVASVILFGSSFTINFLNLKQNTRVGFWLISTIATLGGITFILAWLLPYSATIGLVLFLTIIGSISITAVGFYLWLQKGLLIARYFTLAWSSFLLGSTVIVLNRLHFLPDNALTDNAAQIGSSLEVILLSFALADKFSQMRREKNRVRKQAKQSISTVSSLLSDAMQRLEHANHIKEAFLSTVSHELRTPMNGIIGALQLVDETNLNEENKECLKIADQSSVKMLSLIESMLQFVDIQSALSKLDNEVINWHQMKSELLEFIKGRNITKDIIFEVSMDFPSKQLMLKSDHKKIFSVLQILIDNAIKYTHSGTISVSLTQQHQSENKPSAVLLAVSDTGIGIAPNHLKEIFDAFHQLDNSRTRQYDGLGLGLSVAKSLADLLQATIEVKSTLSSGSCFKLIIPT